MDRGGGVTLRVGGRVAESHWRQSRRWGRGERGGVGGRVGRCWGDRGYVEGWAAKQDGCSKYNNQQKSRSVKKIALPSSPTPHVKIKAYVSLYIEISTFPAFFILTPDTQSIHPTPTPTPLHIIHNRIRKQTCYKNRAVGIQNFRNTEPFGI